ncbi:unnamed protein product [Musa acuminata subsp. malaccensis]|uniref:(wild Malaysian banana) hypothetical protein n=1 Tax=Musa acuminata subsp. malaccensis TaxID=214687 RepID=A0A804KGN8_MUSAM|nr:unnamed protein product [Musa acuminata subsp. malaccensis]
MKHFRFYKEASAIHKSSLIDPNAHSYCVHVEAIFNEGARNGLGPLSLRQSPARFIIT